MTALGSPHISTRTFVCNALVLTTLYTDPILNTTVSFPEGRFQEGISVVVSIKDLDFVYSEAGFDREAYRSFPLTLQSRAGDAAQARSTVEPAIAGADSVARRDSPVSLATHNVPGLTGKSAAPQHRPAAVGELLAQSNGGHDAGESTFDRAVTVAGAAGGVGATTIAATLARVCSRRGRSVFFFDAAEESIVPLYLGAGRIVSGTSPGWSFLPHPELHQGAISVVACGSTPAVGNVQSPWSRARSLGGIAADIVIDSGSLHGFESPAEIMRGTTSLVVLAPDIRCVLQVRGIERRFATGDADSLPQYVLNQFDPEIPLHQEVRASLANHLGDRLAPTAIRTAREIPQALSAGLTVIDYAPNSHVANDIVLVADWLRSRTTSPPHPKQSAAVAGLS